MLARGEPRSSIATDPISFVHRYERVEDRELVGLLASSLAYGNVKVVLASIDRVLSLLGPHPSALLSQMDPALLARDLSSFVHRFTKGVDVAGLLHSAAVCQAAYGTLGRLFSESYWSRSRGDLRRSIHELVSAMRGVDYRPVHGRKEPPEGLSYLLPDGTGPGACKRLNMYLRWMVRGPDGVDLGIWSDIPTSALLMPLDTHTARISRYIGLTTRRDASWRTAEEVTWNLRGVDPRDPIRYDFALAHLGISKACRHRAGGEGCRDCPLRGVCALGQPEEDASDAPCINGTEADEGASLG